MVNSAFDTTQFFQDTELYSKRYGLGAPDTILQESEGKDDIGEVLLDKTQRAKQDE